MIVERKIHLIVSIIEARVFETIWVLYIWV